MVKKEKLLVTSNFSFSHDVFYSYISIVHQNAALCGNGLTLYQTTKIVDFSKLEAFADNKINVTQKLKFALGRVDLQNIVGKGENAGNKFQLFVICKCFEFGLV